MCLDIYRNIALSQVPRILGLGDRNENSKTYGCFDRYYWHYRLSDFPNARFQEVALLLAILYKDNFIDNIYYKNEKILEWAKATIEFWGKIRNKDGSVNEVYPYERSFCATSFSAYSISEAILKLNLRFDFSLEKTGDWLAKNDNLKVANQMSGAILALYNIFLITKKDKYRKAVQDKIKLLRDSYKLKGFFSEYGGLDIGYTTITLSFLAKYFLKSKDESILDMLKDSVKILEQNIRHDGSYDYLKMSRKTQFIYPYGLKVLGSDAIKKHMQGLGQNKIINPAWFDDRYIIQITTDYLQSFLEKEKIC